jgi:hypothetical protein
VTGLYVGKIFGQVKGRPLYVVDEACSADDEIEREVEHAAARQSLPS